MTGKPTIKLEPNPAVANARFTVTGTGFVPREGLTVRLEHSEMLWSPRMRPLSTGADGSFSLESTSHVEGTVKVTALRASATKRTKTKGRGRPVLEPVASATLTVEGTTKDGE